MNNLIEKLKHHGKERKRVRRQMIKHLRQNKNLLKKDRKLQRKIQLNYIGDFSDDTLITYMRKIEKRRETENAIH